MKRFVLYVSLLSVWLVDVPTTRAGIINGGFDTGDFTGWTLYDFQGSLGSPPTPMVSLFDTTNSGNPSLSAEFNVGRDSDHTFGGGGLFQNVTLSSGLLTIQVDIAAYNNAFAVNAEGGLFELLFDGTTVDSFHFLSIAVGEKQFGTLNATLPVVTAGNHEIRIQVTREFVTTSTTTPHQFLDNVQISGSAATVPEPSSLLLTGLGAMALSLAVRSRRNGSHARRE